MKDDRGNNRRFTRAQVAAAEGVHPDTVTKWKNRGCPIARRGRRGVPDHYDIGVVRAWRVSVESKPSDNAGVVDLARERSRKERAQALLAEQKYAERAGQLLEAEDVRVTWAGHVVAVRAKLLAIPQALTARVCRAYTTGGEIAVERVLEDAMHEALEELAGTREAPTPRPRPQKGTATKRAKKKAAKKVATKATKKTTRPRAQTKATRKKKAATKRKSR